MAAANNDVRTLQKLWSWAEEGQLDPNELKKKLILEKDQHGCTAWQHAAQQGSSQALQALQLCAEEMKLNIDELLPAENYIAEQNYEMAGQLFVWVNEKNELHYGGIA
jgi:hypothetical protein